MGCGRLSRRRHYPAGTAVGSENRPPSQPGLPELPPEAREAWGSVVAVQCSTIPGGKSNCTGAAG